MTMNVRGCAAMVPMMKCRLRVGPKLRASEGTGRTHAALAYARSGTESTRLSQERLLSRKPQGAAKCASTSQRLERLGANTRKWESCRQHGRRSATADRSYCRFHRWLRTEGRPPLCCRVSE